MRIKIAEILYLKLKDSYVYTKITNLREYMKYVMLSRGNTDSSVLSADVYCYHPLLIFVTTVYPDC
jgi:hypothetical protein